MSSEGSAVVNWRRGLFRVYLVVWIAWGVVSGLFVIQKTHNIAHIAALAREYRRNGSPKPPANGLIGALEIIELREAGCDTSYMNVDRIRQGADAASDPDGQAPIRHILQWWAAWFVIGAMAPGGLLWLGRWVWSGFRY